MQRYSDCFADNLQERELLFNVGCVPLGLSGSESVIQDHSDNGASKDYSSVPLMHHDLSDLGSPQRNTTLFIATVYK